MMLWQKFTFYIGADNDSGMVDYERISALFSEEFDGFTIIPCTGYWLGKPEHSCKVEVIVQDEENHNWMMLVRRLKKILKQDAILFTKEKLSRAFIG